jgi:tetratricopeptide (TPR) repeat protein
MKKILLSTLIAALSFQVAAQNDSQNENVIRFMTRGKAALETAEKPEDYKLAADEFKKALEYDAKCADIYEQLAICYEQLGKLDPGNYKQAINYLNTYRSLRPDAPNKQEIQEKIYKLEFLMEKAGGMSLKNLVGKWKFYWGSGDDDDFFNIEIFENKGNFYAKCICDLRKNRILSPDSKGEYNTNEKWTNWKNDECNNIIKYEDGVVSFEADASIHFWTIYVYNKRGKWTEGNSKYWNLKYNLRFENSNLAGDRLCTKYLVQVKNISEDSDEWDTITDCEDDCGNSKVYFVKQ